MARELVVQHALHELTSSSGPHDFSASELINFCLRSVENPDYAFLLYTHLERLDSIFAYRAHLCSGFSPFVDAAQASFAKLCSATHHPMYKLLDTIMWLSDSACQSSCMIRWSNIAASTPMAALGAISSKLPVKIITGWRSWENALLNKWVSKTQSLNGCISLLARE